MIETEYAAPALIVLSPESAPLLQGRRDPKVTEQYGPVIVYQEISSLHVR